MSIEYTTNQLRTMLDARAIESKDLSVQVVTLKLKLEGGEAAREILAADNAALRAKLSRLIEAAEEVRKVADESDHLKPWWVAQTLGAALDKAKS